MAASVCAIFLLYDIVTTAEDFSYLREHSYKAGSVKENKLKINCQSDAAKWNLVYIKKEAPPSVNHRLQLP